MQGKVEICGVNTAKLQVLKNEEMTELLKRVKHGDQEARQKMIEGNLRLELRREDVVFALDAISDPISLYEPIYSDGGDAICVMDQVRDDKNCDEQWLNHLALREAMGQLGEREQRILKLRFFQGKTQMEVSKEVGISQAQVSRLEKNALKQIRKAL